MGYLLKMHIFELMLVHQTNCHNSPGICFANEFLGNVNQILYIGINCHLHLDVSVALNKKSFLNSLN